MLELDPESVDGKYYHWYIKEKGKEEVQIISNHSKIEDWIIDDVVCNEHTVAVKEDGVEILTALEDDEIVNKYMNS